MPDEIRNICKIVLHESHSYIQIVKTTKTHLKGIK
jgi:hypothetical protein